MAAAGLPRRAYQAAAARRFSAAPDGAALRVAVPVAVPVARRFSAGRALAAALLAAVPVAVVAMAAAHCLAAAVS
jgi:hypothetical protein